MFDVQFVHCCGHVKIHISIAVADIRIHSLSFLKPFQLRQTPFDSSAIATKQLLNHLHTSFGMTPGPKNLFASAATVKFIMGFPDIIGHQTVYGLFIDRDDGCVAPDAS